MEGNPWKYWIILKFKFWSTKTKWIKDLWKNRYHVDCRRNAVAHMITFSKSLQNAIILWNNSLQSMYTEATGRKRNNLIELHIAIQRGAWISDHDFRKNLSIWKLKALTQPKKEIMTFSSRIQWFFFFQSSVPCLPDIFEYDHCKSICVVFSPSLSIAVLLKVKVCARGLSGDNERVSVGVEMNCLVTADLT